MAIGVLIGEGDSELRLAMTRFLRSHGYRVLSSSDGRRTLRMVRRETARVAIVDLTMRGMTGPKLLAANAGRSEPLALLAVVPEDRIYEAVAALRGGVYEYLTKPFEMDHMEWLLQRAAAVSGPGEGLTRTLLDGSTGGRETRPLFGFSRSMQGIFRSIQRAALSRPPVLLLGEAGTGKELVARVLHHASARRDGPFVALLLGSLGADELPMRLFGSGDDPRTGGGAISAAHGGTLFIDEVQRLPMEAQQRLVRSLKGHPDGPAAGDDGDEVLDVRLVASSERDLTAQLGEGTIRSELYWYLRALTIRIPPLRERREDILPLARWLLARHATSSGQPPRILAPEALHWLQDHHWPGNVRELESVLVRGLTLGTRTVLGRDDLAGPSRRLDERVIGVPDQSFEDLLLNRLRPVVRSFTPGPRGSDLYDLVIEAAEKAVITLALRRCQGNQSAAARLLGINRNTLRTKIAELRIPHRNLKRRRS